jgi:fatty acid-binding protein DegV
VRLREKVRTSGRALARLVELALDAAGDGPVDVAVHHLAAPARAEAVAAAMRDRLGGRLRTLLVTEVGAVIAAHAGPGMAGVVVHRVA